MSLSLSLFNGCNANGILLTQRENKQTRTRWKQYQPSLSQLVNIPHLHASFAALYASVLQTTHYLQNTTTHTHTHTHVHKQRSRCYYYGDAAGTMHCSSSSARHSKACISFLSMLSPGGSTRMQWNVNTITASFCRSQFWSNLVRNSMAWSHKHWPSTPWFYDDSCNRNVANKQRNKHKIPKTIPYRSCGLGEATDV